MVETFKFPINFPSGVLLLLLNLSCQLDLQDVEKLVLNIQMDAIKHFAAASTRNTVKKKKPIHS